MKQLKIFTKKINNWKCKSPWRKLNCYSFQKSCFKKPATIKKQDLHYTRGITPKCETRGGAQCPSPRLAPEQHSSKKRRSGGEPLATLCRRDRPGNRTPDLPHG